VLDQPVTGRIFFEEVIRENLDLGRPSQVSLVFDRKVTRRTPGRFRTRVITDGVVPSLHVDYKKSRIKQYHKEGQARFGLKRPSTTPAILRSADASKIFRDRTGNERTGRIECCPHDLRRFPVQAQCQTSLNRQRTRGYIRDGRM
jgi:hypothetical protein